MDFDKLADEYLETVGRHQTKLPQISEFSREYIGVNEDTVNLWLKDESKKKLFGAIKKIKAKQKEQLINDGMYGGREVNNAMAIFLLKANHGLIETDRTIHEGEGLNITLDIRPKDGEKEVHTDS